MSVGYKENTLRYYLSKNDFWRLRSQADGLSGPRVAGFMDISIEGLDGAKFTASQLIQNGETTCFLSKENGDIQSRSWVSATENLAFIELSAINISSTFVISAGYLQFPQ